MSKFRLLLTVSLVWCALWPSQRSPTGNRDDCRNRQRRLRGRRPRCDFDRDQHSNNIITRTQSGDDGGYVIPSLRPGQYSVSAESAGFQKTVRTGVTLQVAQVARIDMELQAGQLTEALEVVGQSPLLDTLTSSRGSVSIRRRSSSFR